MITRSLLRLSTPMAATAASLVPLKVCVKAADTVPNALGDCNTTPALRFPLLLSYYYCLNLDLMVEVGREHTGPFCHRVLLTLEEKKLPYETKLINLKQKPEWFLQVNPGGKVPVIDFGDGKWIADSDVITAMIEKKYPEPSLATPPEYATVGSNILFAFMKFLKSKDPSDGSEQALLSELQAFDEHLKNHGPFVNGENISAVDFSLAPKLYHLEVTLEHFKGWSIPHNLSHLRAYLELLFTRESFTKTTGGKEYIIAGWETKLIS